MFTSVVAALALAASVSRVAASPLHRMSPIHHLARDYAKDAALLEDYTTYHIRYLALSCQDKHNTAFFKQCCHPLLRSQKLSDRPAKCTPSASESSSAAIAEPSAASVDEDPLPIDEDDCDDDEPSSSHAAPTATSTSAPESTSSAAPEKTSFAAPEKTSSAPESTSSYKPTSTHTSSAAPSSSAAPAPGNGGGDAITGGFATFFTQNGSKGACGILHDDYDLVVAADYRRYGALDKESDLCGKKVLITNTDNGKTVTAVIADACPSCESKNCLDLSLGAFDKIADREKGMVPISWTFV